MISFSALEHTISPCFTTSCTFIYIDLFHINIDTSLVNALCHWYEHENQIRIQLLLTLKIEYDKIMIFQGQLYLRPLQNSRKEKC